MAEPTQSGTFVGGLMRGWRFGKGMQRREAQEERQQQQFEMQQQLNELQTEATRIELGSAKAQQRRDEALRRLDTAMQAYNAGNKDLAAREFQEGIGTLDMSVEDFSPEFAEAASTLERAFKKPGSVDNQQAVAAANRVFRNRVKSGIGETTTRNGKTVTITDKRITEIAPAPTSDGQGNQIEPGIMARMEVTGKTADGETVTWRAPLTRDRSTRDDDPAQSVPIDEIARQVIGRKKLMQGIASSPEFRDMLRIARTRAGAEPQETMRTVRGEALGLSGGLFQVDSQTGEISEVVEPPDVEAGYSVVPGSQLPNSNITGGLYKVNNETGEPIELVAPKEGGTSDILTGTVINSIEGVVDRKLTDTFSANGVPVYDAGDNKELATLSERIGQRMYFDSHSGGSGRALTPAEAGDKAINRVMDARRQAKQEAEELTASQDIEQQRINRYVRNRTRELLGLKDLGGDGRQGPDDGPQDAETDLSDAGDESGMASRYTVLDGQGNPRTVTSEQIRATAEARGMTPQQVIETLDAKPAQ